MKENAGIEESNIVKELDMAFEIGADNRNEPSSGPTFKFH